MSKILKPRRGKYSTMTGSKSATVLLDGEIFIEMPSNGINSGNGDCRIKVGDGTSAYNGLSYAVGAPNMTFRDGEIIQQSGVNISTTETTTNSAVTTTVAATNADLEFVASGKTLGQLIGTLKSAITRTAQAITKINSQISNINNTISVLSSYVGMIIYSRNLSTEAQVQSVYGSNTYWNQIKDVFLLSAGSSYAANGTGGSANTTIPEHYHKYSLLQHTHNYSGTTSTYSWDHRHETANAQAPNFLVFNGELHSEVVGSIKDGDYVMPQLSKGTHWWGGSWGGTQWVHNDHNHTFKGTTGGINANNSGNTGTAGTGNGKGTNMPPYLTVYVWERVSSH